MVIYDEMYGAKGSNYYLINTKYKEAMRFSQYGVAEGRETPMTAIQKCRLVREVNILSVLRSNLGISELYYGGTTYLIKMDSLDLYTDLYKRVKSICSVHLRVPYDCDDGSDVMQFIIPALPGYISTSDIENLYKNFIIKKGTLV